MAQWENKIIGTGTEVPDQLLANPQNWRIHPQVQRDTLAEAIETVGYISPVIVNQTTGHVIDGHLRISLALSQNQKEIPVSYVELTEEQEKIALASLDPVAGMAVPDNDMLGELLSEIDLGEGALADLFDGMADGGEQQTEEVATPEVPEKAKSKRGELYVLGKHRVMCGDSTSAEDVERLMGGEKAVLMVTDPPYGVAYGVETGNGNKFGAITNDENDGPKLQAFLEVVFATAVPHLTDNAAWYLWHAQMTQGFFAAAAAAAAADVIIHRQIIWVKPSLILGHGDYHWRHELCFYGWREGNRPKWYGDRKQTTVWEIDKVSDRNHPTQKPIEVFSRPLRFNTKENDVCYEPFAGSGSQFIACEQLNRRCYGMEIEPRYVDVIRKRWAEYVHGEGCDWEKLTTNEKPRRKAGKKK